MSRRAARRILRAVAALVAAIAACFICGCLSAAYVVQAAGGQCEIVCKARPIRDVVTDQATPESLKELLASVADVKRYAVANGMRPTSSYTKYVDLERPYVVWVVSASEPLRFHAKEWHFPIVGSVPYLGWFDRDDAAVHARQLRAAGWDVDVRGTSAYSTLGWFEDPVLSTMIEKGPQARGELANTVLHESVHATVYVSSESLFNESLAEFVADRMAVAYLNERVGSDAVETRAYLAAEAEGDRRTRRLHEAYVALEHLYASSRSVTEKLAEKARVLAALRAELGLPRPISNATLMQYRTYNTGADAFARLLASCGGNWRRFFAAIGSADTTWFTRPQQDDFGSVVDRLIRVGCR